MPKPVTLLLIASVFLAGCATPGPTSLYLAGEATQAVQEIALESGQHTEYDGGLQPGDRVIGLGYEFNTDYVWLRLAPGNRLVVIKRHEEEFWYDYTLPDTFMVPADRSADLAVRAFNRMVYAALSGGRVAEITRYGEILGEHPLSESGREIGGLAWDQAGDSLLVLWADGGEVSWYARRDWQLQRTVALHEAVDPFSLAYDSNRSRLYVPLAGREHLGEFDLQGNLIGQLPLPKDVGGIDAGQRSTVRVF